MISLAWPLCVVVVAYIAYRAAMEAFRLRADLRVVRDSAAAILKHEARLNAVERALEMATSERIA